jgi:hypothetical protein
MNGLFIGIIYLVSLALLITLFFTVLLKNKGPWGNFWSFLIVILLAVFAADVWIGPVGPYWFHEIYWVPPLAVGLIIALLLAATVPSPKTRNELELEARKPDPKEKVPVIYGIFFWLLFLVLLILITVGFFQ